jgi:hypothetical protein
MKKIMPTFWLALCSIALVGQLTAQTWQPAGPAPRWGHSAVFDPVTKSMIVFGGRVPGANANPYILMSDVWRLNNNLTWVALAPTGTPPTARYYHTAVYDSSNDRMIVFGGAQGNTSPCANDVWVLTNATGKRATPGWLQLSPSGGPSPRSQHGAVYDPNTNSMIVYGGADCFSTFFSEVWVLSDANGLGGTPTWTQLFPAGGPGGRAIEGGVAYDFASNRLMVFGGASPSPGQSDNNDVWVLSNANGHGGTPIWTQLFPSGSLPTARNASSTVYDPKSNRLIIASGEANRSPLSDAWVLTNANGLGGTPAWTQLGPFPLFPEARELHTAVYDPKKNKMTIFGGEVSLTVDETTNDVWVLDHANGK